MRKKLFRTKLNRLLISAKNTANYTRNNTEKDNCQNYTYYHHY